MSSRRSGPQGSANNSSDGGEEDQKPPEGLRGDREAVEGADEGAGLLLDAPQLKLEGLSLALKDVRVARVVEIGELNVTADNLDAQLLLKLRLDDVLKAVNRFFDSLDSTATRVQEIAQDNPETIETLVQSLREVAQEALANGGGESSGGEEPAGAGGEQTSRLSVDASGEILESILDGSGQVVDESVRGNVQDLPVEEEFFDGEGQLMTRWRDEEGNLFEGRLDEEGGLVYAGVVQGTEDETA